MRRVQFLEFHEQAWLPSFLRDEITDALQFGLSLFKAYAPIAPLLQRALASTQSRSVVDICSGGGGPWFDLSPKLQANVLLTDKYPNVKTSRNVEAASGNRIAFHP